MNDGEILLNILLYRVSLFLYSISIIYGMNWVCNLITHYNFLFPELNFTSGFCWIIHSSSIICGENSFVPGFYLRPVLAFGYCRCLRLSVCVSVRPCVNHELVRTITHDPFQLGSPNLALRCKRPWLRSLLFWGVIDLDLQGQILLQSQNLPHFELVCAITHSCSTQGHQIWTRGAKYLG